MVDELKAAYKVAKHAFYKDKTNEKLKQEAVRAKARLRRAETHLGTLKKPEAEASVRRSKWGARIRKAGQEKQQRDTAMPWAPKY